MKLDKSIVYCPFATIIELFFLCDSELNTIYTKIFYAVYYICIIKQVILC